MRSKENIKEICIFIELILLPKLIQEAIHHHIPIKLFHPILDIRLK